jgi:miniconductance mechanosensitive channel
MKESIIEFIKHYYTNQIDGQEVFNKIAYENHAVYWTVGMTIALILASICLWYISRFIILRILYVLIDRTKVEWDDHFVKNKVFRSIAQLVPLMFLEYFLSIAFYQYPAICSFWTKVVLLLIVVSIMITVNRTLNAFRDIVCSMPRYEDKPIQSYFQVMKITTSGIFIILMLSLVTNKTPLFFLTSLGAMMALLIVIFKDTILGFVGSIQLAANDLIRIGDWITMDKFGADGNVTEINLATVKIQNFDNTITTIPTYSFISDSFKNWRGMKDSDGRRIKRAINIQIGSVHFANEELLERLKEVKILQDLVVERQDRIHSFIVENNISKQDSFNGPRQTNIGLYRKYIEFYLRNNQNINQDMLIMVRQLSPTDSGIPIEIYCFSSNKDWLVYEEVMADIFDHIFAITHLFELRFFEKPTGYDMRNMLRN